jgi:hypothetical protein
MVAAAAWVSAVQRWVGKGAVLIHSSLEARRRLTSRAIYASRSVIDYSAGEPESRLERGSNASFSALPI